MEHHQLEKYTQDGQDTKLVEKIYRKTLDMLIPGESINYIALQKKPAVTLLPDSITISNKRIFLCEFTKLGWATNFEIFFWRDIKDMAFKEEIFGSKVTVIPYTGENLTVDYIPKVQARKLYQLIRVALDNIQQAKKEPSDEGNAIGNPPVAAKKSQLTENKHPRRSIANDHPRPTPSPEAPSKPIPETRVPSAPEMPDDEMTRTLRKLKNLYDKQLISQAEYETKKAEILNRL